LLILAAIQRIGSQYKGLTGFDSKDSGTVSMQGIEDRAL
jgi:hypothetical protein